MWCFVAVEEIQTHRLADHEADHEVDREVVMIEMIVEMRDLQHDDLVDLEVDRVHDEVLVEDDHRDDLVDDETEDETEDEDALHDSSSMLVSVLSMCRNVQKSIRHLYKLESTYHSDGILISDLVLILRQEVVMIFDHDTQSHEDR